MIRSGRIRISRRSRLVALFAILGMSAGFGTGCATFGAAPEGPGREIRPEAPPEYDVLVYNEHLADGHPQEAIAALERALAKDEQSPVLHRMMAETLARSGELDRAVEHARRARELAPDDPEVRSILAQLFRIQQNSNEAEKLLLDAQGHPIDDDAAWLLYQIHLETNQLDSALDTARWMTQQKPDEPRGWLALANVYEKQEKPLEAEKALRKSLQIDPANLRIYAALARSMRNRGDKDGAIGVYHEMLRHAPDDHATLSSLAEAQINDEDVEGATETLERIEASYPSDLESVKRLGYLLYESHRFAEAVTRFERVLAASPREYEVAFFDGVALRRVNRDADAMRAFERVAPQHEYYAEARTQIAAIHERHGRYAEALAEVERALATEPSRELELYSATLRSKAGDFEGAVSYLEGLLASNPDDDELLYNLGVVYGEKDRDDEAIKYMQRALEKNPDNADALNFIGYTWAEHGENLEQAEQYITRAMELRPDNGYIVDSLGWVYYMRARPLMAAGDVAAGRKWLNKAIAELQRAHELTGGDPVISEHIGDAYLLLDERRRALAKFEEAAVMGPRPEEQPELKQKLESLRRELE
ncbi:MAG TPA: tetratricopeptide repeat protein [Myxococcota bacterium]|nr:tetratricopeptide repeat protein [Myxococcota bacterium]